MRKFLVTLTLLSLGLTVAACGASSSATQPTSASVPRISATNTSKFGTIVVAPNGMVLYAFTSDTPTTSHCHGACASVWSPLIASRVSVSSALKASLITYINRGAGKKQVAYNGHPLYLFADDTTAGVATGEGLHSFGGSWYVVSSSGVPVTFTSAHSGATSSTSSSAYGY